MDLVTSNIFTNSIFYIGIFSFIILCCLCTINIVLRIKDIKNKKDIENDKIDQLNIDQLNIDRINQLEISLSNVLQNISSEIRSQIHQQNNNNTNNNILLQNSINQNIQTISSNQENSQERIYKQLLENYKANEVQLEKIRENIHNQLYKIQHDNSAHLHKIQEDNNNKLEKMRETVEEKLQSTLEKRIGTSFQIVSDRLEMVHKGLGEMQSIANGVGDLKRVLNNVKTRGVWGEVQLNNILQQLLTKDQYESNVQIRKNSKDRVEYAIKLPGNYNKISSDTGVNSHIWLPIDAKFPLAEYHRFIDAQESGDFKEADIQIKFLESNIKKAAKTIADKYIHPPMTTDFAIMFLPIEGMYAEVLKRPGLIETLQRDYRIIITGPTTLSALLNSLQMGFKTLMIEKRSSEVWQTLGIIRNEFIKFAELLSKTRIKLEQAGQVIGDAENKTKSINKKLNRLDEYKGGVDAIDAVDVVIQNAIPDVMPNGANDNNVEEENVEISGNSNRDK